MPRPPAAFRAALLLLALLPPGLARGQQGAGADAPPRSIAGAFPADALAWVGSPDLAELSADAKRCALGRIWADEGSSALRAEVSRLVDGLSDQVRAELGVDPLQFPAMVSGGLALALLEADGSSLSAALVADVGGHADEAGALLDGWLDRLADARGGTRRTEVHAGYDVAALSVHGAEGEPWLLLRGTLVEGRLYVTLRRGPAGVDDLARLLDLRNRPAGDPATLAGGADFRSSPAGGEDGLLVWLDLAALLARAAGPAAAAVGPDTVFGGVIDVTEAEAQASHLGLLGLSTRWVREDKRTRLATRLDWDPAGLVAQVLHQAVRPGASRLLPCVPADASGVDVLRLDPGQLIDGLLRVLLRQGALTPPDLAQFLAHLEEQLGFDPRAELLDRLEGEFVLVGADVGAGESLPGWSGRPTNLVLLATLHDGAGLAELVDRRLADLGLTVSVQRYVVHGAAVARLELFRPFVLNWSISDDLLVASTSGELVERVLATRAGGGAGSLAADEGARTALERVPASAFAFGFTRAAEAWITVLDALRGLAGSGRTLPPGLRWAAQLPTDEVVRRHVSGWVVSSLAADERGLSYSIEGP